MAKVKTHKITAKRFRVTKLGKVVYKAAGWRHLKSKKDAKIKYRKNLPRTLSEASARGIRRLLNK